MQDQELIDEVVLRLRRALSDRLISVVLYGPRARGETVRAVAHLNLLVVAADLDPDTLADLGGPIHWWLRKGQPWVRLFSRALIRDSLDVYPIEFLDISRHHRVLYGEDPLAGLQLDLSHLRPQCERDLREKLMRLREGYVESRGSKRQLQRLMAASYTSMAPLWRACLHLLGEQIPANDHDVVACLCRRLELDGAPIDEVGLLAAGARAKDPDALFGRYLRQLTETIRRIDRLDVEHQGGSP